MGTREVLPYLGLGNIARHGGELKEAEKWLAQARQLQPDHPAVLLALGRVAAANAAQAPDEAAAKKDWQEARELLERSKASELETSATLYSELGNVYMKLGMWDEAAESYKQALRMRRKQNEWRFALGQAYAQLGKIPEAELKYREVLAFSPDDADAVKALQAIGKRY
jgi:tetratricopeptide (TPR) repeat protein